MDKETTPYQKKLAHPKWQKKRLEVLKRDKFKCKLCGDTETMLHVHHFKYTTAFPHDEPLKNLVTYCSDCHFVIENTDRSIYHPISALKIRGQADRMFFILNFGECRFIFLGVENKTINVLNGFQSLDAIEMIISFLKSIKCPK